MGDLVGDVLDQKQNTRPGGGSFWTPTRKRGSAGSAKSNKTQAGACLCMVPAAARRLFLYYLPLVLLFLPSVLLFSVKALVLTQYRIGETHPVCCLLARQGVSRKRHVCVE